MKRIVLAGFCIVAVVAQVLAQEQSFEKKNDRDQELRNGYKVIEINPKSLKPTVHYFGDDEHDRAWDVYKTNKDLMSVNGGLPPGYSIKPPALTEGGRQRQLQLRNPSTPKESRQPSKPAATEPPPTTPADEAVKRVKEGFDKGSFDNFPKPKGNAEREALKRDMEAFSRDLAAAKQELAAFNRDCETYMKAKTAWERAFDALEVDADAINRAIAAYNALPSGQRSSAEAARIEAARAQLDAKRAGLLPQENALAQREADLSKRDAAHQQRGREMHKRKEALMKREAALSGK